MHNHRVKCLVIFTCGKSSMPSLCANIALVNRLVICNARAALYLSLSFTMYLTFAVGIKGEGKCQESKRITTDNRYVINII